MSKKAKLEIPSPDRATSDSLFIAYVLAALVLTGLGYYFNQMPDPADEKAKKVKAVTPKEKNEVVESLIDERSTAAVFKKMESKELRERSWTDVERQAVYRFGPRNASEVLCELDEKTIANGKLGKKLLLELEKTLDRRADFAPWACLMRLHLDSKIVNKSLANEVESFVVDLEKFGSARLAIDLVDWFRTTRNRPKSKRFYIWLRRCALNLDYAPRSSCQKTLSQISPAEGVDILETYDLQVTESADADDLKMFIRTLGSLVRNGQPEAWQIKSSKELPDYNVDLKIAATLSLCRYSLSESSSLAFTAAEQLATAAEIKLRGNNKNTIDRWWVTCSILFGGDEGGETVPPAIVSNVLGTDEFIYPIKLLRDAGLCTVKTGYPNWACASEKWAPKGTSVSDAIAEAFVKTAWVEFAESASESGSVADQ